MKNLKIKISILVLTLITIFSSCSKNDSPLPTPDVAEPQTFTPFVNLSAIFPTSSVSCIDYHAPTKNLYVMSEPASGGGYTITQINTITKQATTVYNSPTTSGNNSSLRIRIIGNSIYIPAYYNNKIVRLDGIGTNTLTLGTTITPPTTGVLWRDPFDVAIAGKIYLIDKYNSKIVKGDSPSFTNLDDFSFSPNATFGSSLVYTSSNNNAFVISTPGGTNAPISAHNPSTGLFIRSVQPSDFGNGGLVKDSQDRVYYMGRSKVIRYSADLLTSEVFKIEGQNGSDYSQFTISEEANKIRIYIFNGISVPNAGAANFGINSMTIPK